MNSDPFSFLYELDTASVGGDDGDRIPQKSSRLAGSVQLAGLIDRHLLRSLL